MTGLAEIKFTTTANVLGGLTDLESNIQAVEYPVVQIKVDYFSCPELRSAVNILKKEILKEEKSKKEKIKEEKIKEVKINSKAVAKFPNEHHQYRVYYLRPNIPIFMVNKTSVDAKSVTLTLEDITALIKEFNAHTTRNKELVERKAKDLFFVRRYFYLRKANKVVHEEELMVAQATAYLMQKVLKELEEIAIPQSSMLTEAEIPANFLRRWVEQVKKYLTQKVLALFKKFRTPKNKVQRDNSAASNSNSYKHWIAFIMVMSCHYIPMFYMSFYFAAESMESLAPYLFFISPHVMAALGVICTINILYGTICFFGPTIMEWFTVHFSDTTPSLPSVYKQQLETTKSINNHLTTHNNLSANTYEKYIEFSKKVGDIPSQKKAESVLATILTWSMTALAGIEALSNSIMVGATLLGLLFGVFTIATLTPPLLTAFIASHLCGVFLMSVPLALSQSIVSYISRVTSASRLLDVEKDERDAVEKMRLAYIAGHASIELQLYEYLDEKKELEKYKKIAEPDGSFESKKTMLETQKKKARRDIMGLLFKHKQPVIVEEFILREKCLKDIVEPDARSRLKSRKI